MCNTDPVDPTKGGKTLIDPVSNYVTKKLVNKFGRDPMNLFGGKGPEHDAEAADQAAASAAATAQAEADRRKVEADATTKANQDLLGNARRRRAQRGLLSTEAGSSILASGAPTNALNVLSSGRA